MLNVVWLVMILAAVVCGALTGRIAEVSRASTELAGTAVDLAIGLVGVMAFWIGAMRILQLAGVLRWVARLLSRPLRWLFPDVPPDHPAMSMMIMNITSNMLGLGNAATPFGLKAMLSLDELNRTKGTATDAMVLFLAINTSGLALLPTGIISLRASLGAANPGSIVLTTLMATAVSTTVAILVTKALGRLPAFAIDRHLVTDTGSIEEPRPDVSSIDTSEAEAMIQAAPPPVRGTAAVGFWVAMALVVGSLLYNFVEAAVGTPAAMTGFKALLGADPVEGLGWRAAARDVFVTWPLPVLIAVILLVGMSRGVKVYDALVEGGKEGFQVAIKVIPYLVAILVAVGMLRASGALDLLVSALAPITQLVGMPAEALPMALLRPLSGSGAYAVAGELMKVHGPDSLVGNIVSTMQGSTETTFYVLALYFGVVGIRRIRHTLWACLVCDACGALAAVWAVRLVL